MSLDSKLPILWSVCGQQELVQMKNILARLIFKPLQRMCGINNITVIYVQLTEEFIILPVQDLSPHTCVAEGKS